MNKKALIVLIIIYLIMLGLNFLVPLYYGDDYVYAFIWPNQFMNIPLPENVVNVNSVTDLIISQWRHYFTCNGRTIAHLFVQFFVWQGKWLFNLINPLVFVLLILQIHWISNEGSISFQNLRASNICWIFFVLWAFVADFYSVYLWLAGACNYLWSVVILLFFLMPYVRYFFSIGNNITHICIFKFLFFCLGVCAGWGNENTICWIILLLSFWLYKLYKKKQTESWMTYGFIGLCLGYALLIFAPGNAVRTNYYLENYFMNNWLTIFSVELIKTRLINFGTVEYLQIMLWYYILTSFRRLDNKDKFDNKYCILAKWCCGLSLLFNIIMLLTPEFPLRSGFASLVFITIAVSLITRVHNIKGDYFNDFALKKKLTFGAGMVFVVTLFGTYLGYFQIYDYDSDLQKKIQYHKQLNAATVLEITEYKYKEQLNMLYKISGGHLMQATLSTNENHWQNVAVARYYGIKGIRMVDGEQIKK